MYKNYGIFDTVCDIYNYILYRSIPETRWSSSAVADGHVSPERVATFDSDPSLPLWTVPAAGTWVATEEATEEAV